MIKFLLGFLVSIFLVIIGVVVAVPVLTKVVGPDMMMELAPQPGVPLGERDFPIPERSLVAVKLKLPLQALADVTNAKAPRKLVGSVEKNVHEKIHDGIIHWQMFPGPVKINNAGRDLTFYFPVAGDAYSTGKLTKLNIPIKGSAQVEGVISGRLAPSVTRDWTIFPRITPMLKVHRAELTLGKLGTIDGRQKVHDALAPVVAEQAEKVGPNLAKTLNLKPGIQKIWDQAHINKRIAPDVDSWVVFDPGFVQMGQIDYSDSESLAMTLGIVAQSYITSSEPGERLPEELPDLDLLSTDPLTEIRVPIIADFQVLNEMLVSRTFPIENKFGAALEISAPQIHMAPSGYLDVVMKVNALDGQFADGLYGKVQIRARPIIDCVTQTMGFSDVSLAYKTKEMLSETAAWLMEDILVKSIENDLRIDLKEYLPKLEDEIHKVVGQLNIPDHVGLSVAKPDVHLLGAYTIERPSWNAPESPGIVFVLGARSHIEVEMKRLVF